MSETLYTNLPKLVSKKLSEAVTLQDLEKEYAFFTHGVYLKYGQMTVDPVQQYLANMGSSEVPFLLTSDQPLFTGLGDLLNHSLVVVSLSVWPGLRAYLDSIAITDPKRKFFGRAIRQTLPLYDFYAMEKIKLIEPPYPTIRISAYGLTTNEGIVHFWPAMNPGMPITLRHDPPERQTVEDAQAYFTAKG